MCKSEKADLFLIYLRTSRHSPRVGALLPRPSHTKIHFLVKILDCVFQFLPCFELNGVGCLDLDGFAGAGIPTFAGFSADFRECAEPDQGDLSVLSSGHL